jgi:hypothetical protein
MNRLSFHKKVLTLEQKFAILGSTNYVSDYALQQQAKYKANFYLFIKDAWTALEGLNVAFYDNWHIQAIAEHLEACNRGDINFLIVNMPPRCKIGRAHV